MKRIILLALFAILAISMTFAAGISEVVPTKRATVDLSTGTSSSDVVSAQFNKDGNLELTYKESSLVEITLTGRLDGTLIVRSDNADYILLLDGVFITGDTLPAIQLKSTTTATIRLVEGSANTISDSPNNTKKGAITSSGDIVFDGSDEGQLDINVYKKHGIKTDGGVTINGGDILIVGDENAEGNMISADMYFVMNGGYLNIYAYGNVHASESKGIKVNGVEGTGAGLGYVEVNGGTINIESVGKGITAGWKIAEDATTEDTSDDPIPNVYINDGNVYVYTYGTPYEYSEEESLSPEGIEAKNELFINGGLVALITTDDCLNAGKAVTINGGFVYAFASANDSIDSNGTLAINGGTVICMSSSREQAFDCDNDYNFTYTGGTYVGAGNGNNMPKSDATTGYSIAYGEGTFYAGEHIAVLDSNGDVVTGFVVPFGVDSLTSIVFGTDAFVAGETYTIARGAFLEIPQEGLVSQGAIFKSRENVVEMTLTENTVSQGRIGMNVGTDFPGGIPGGGFPDGRPEDFRGGFNMAEGIQALLFSLKVNADELELPEGMVIPSDITSEEAVQACMHILSNYVDIDTLKSLIEGSMSNGEFDRPPAPGTDLTK